MMFTPSVHVYIRGGKEKMHQVEQDMGFVHFLMGLNECTLL